MTYRIISISQKSDLKQTLLYKSLVKNCIGVDNVIFYGNNKESLNAVYNRGIKKCLEENIKIAILVHDDVYINCNDFEYRIRNYAQKYPVFGLAGATTITFKEPALWHLMSERTNLRGCVAHGNDCNNYMYTSFGPLHSNVVVIDGVLIGINLNNLPENVRFDEKIPSKFHFYDIIFSLECSLNKVKIGIADIPIIHASPGLKSMSDEWKSGQEYFLNKYNKFKNKTLTV
jgi:hypothetical protein